MAECRDCGRELAGDPGFFESCADYELECVAPEHGSIELADVAIVALAWAARRTVTVVLGGGVED